MPSEPDFEPEEILRTLDKHQVRYILVGGMAAVVYGSDEVTTDIDVTPELTAENLGRLSAALRELNARLWTQQEPEGLAFDHDAASLAGVEILNLITDYGRLDITSKPAGTHGFEDLRRDAVRYRIFNIDVLVASLADVVRSKEAAGRSKDLRTLPTLRRLLEEGPTE